MGHTFVRLEGDIVAGFDKLHIGEANGIALNDLLGEGLGDGSGGFEGGEERGRFGVIELRVEGGYLLLWFTT